jgi:hypothetical protein
MRSLIGRATHDRRYDGKKGWGGVEDVILTSAWRSLIGRVTNDRRYDGEKGWGGVEEVVQWQ